MLLQAAEEHSERERERGRREGDRGEEEQTEQRAAARCGKVMQEGFATATDWFAIAPQETEREGGTEREKRGGVRQLSAFGCKIKE